LVWNGLFVVTDAASQTGDCSNKARLRHPRLVSAGLGGHVADLINLALFCLVIEPWAIQVARRVFKCPHILAEQLLYVEIGVRDEESVAEIEAERIDVANKEAVFVLVDLVERLALSALIAATVFSSMALASAAVPCANAVVENKTAMAPSAPTTSLRNMDIPPAQLA